MARNINYAFQCNSKPWKTCTVFARNRATRCLNTETLATLFMGRKLRTRLEFIKDIRKHVTIKQVSQAKRSISNCSSDKQ